ncbi:helix-turn-helix transcriptional regulator [Nocardioides aurantiacus]|uniref:Putative DNA-binding transcriptional regulator YafY n=1 Tax=Nocardioides aurantiacus TaxID=86796 RepID=A0A3N2CU78_9ACTN|nr:WYL domain-containing protein [Nocardioides aurantiacus]ROR91093.1 putative DNA-binding transcriptional regulator YafY [Nocardioides aurantiacus]
MAATSARALELLSLLVARDGWTGSELARRLDVSVRTLRRDIETLRALGYPVAAMKGPEGGYRLAPGTKLPPLQFDDEQAIALAVALQTAPATVSGHTDAAARALTTVKQVMPAHLQAEVDALYLTAIRNYWAFGAPPVEPATLKAVGNAVRASHRLRFDYLTQTGHRPHPADRDFEPPLEVEPHHLVLWAGRWYLVAYQTRDAGWGIYRVDRIHPRSPTGAPFTRRELPAGNVADYVMSSHDRGDTLAPWPCLGTVLIDLPADIVARWAPSGAVVEYLTATSCRFTLGAWSWAGVAGLLATFDADFTILDPPELTHACQQLAIRYHAATGRGPRSEESTIPRR